jgi:hypothetical protein
MSDNKTTHKDVQHESQGKLCKHFIERAWEQFAEENIWT